MLFNNKLFGRRNNKDFRFKIITDTRKWRETANKTHLHAGSNPDHFFTGVKISSRRRRKRSTAIPKSIFLPTRRHVDQTKRLFANTQIHSPNDGRIRNPVIRMSDFSNESSSIATGRTRNGRSLATDAPHNLMFKKRVSAFNSTDPPQRIFSLKKKNQAIKKDTQSIKNKAKEAFRANPSNSKSNVTPQNQKRLNFQNSGLRANFLHSNYKVGMHEELELLNPDNEELQEYFKKICDTKGTRLYNYSLSRTAFREYMLDRYCSNVTERVIFLMQLPKQIKYETYIECCNNLIKMSHYEKQKLSFGFFDHDFDDKISVTDGLLMMRHLTDTEYLMQEDLRVLIKGLLDKQKYHKKQSRRDIHIIHEFEPQKHMVGDKKASITSEEPNKYKRFTEKFDLANGNKKDKMKMMKNSSISSITPASPFKNKVEKMPSFGSKRSSFNDHHQDAWDSDGSFFSETETFSKTIGPPIEEFSTLNSMDQGYMREKPKKKHKNSLRVEDICDTFTKRSNKRANFYRIIEKYCQKKYLFHEYDYLEFKDYLKLKFSCPSPLDSCSFVSTISKFQFLEDRKKQMKNVRTIYPSILYDVYYYVCLYEFKDIKIINPEYYSLIKKQIHKLPMIEDQELINKREELDYLYNDNKLKKLIRDLTNTHGMVKRINIDHLLNKK
ncbi:unnamed protein product [Moneuplotes crassus]|uniref:Uncharacterized protein n=1 Tax=Euplotes crassus TaxID=5936 RepID=A0AAD1XY25_EUPCR|nr:unnamed protein product [Moneuplotes crassus]